MNQSTTKMETRPFELPPSWQSVLASELQKPYIMELATFVEKERAFSPVPIYPPEELVFNALFQTPFEQVKVVIVGQDPYHGVGQAHGLSFSVPVGVPTPPSLLNIYKELQADLGVPIPTSGCLLPWAKQGVLLLNALMTVRQSAPLSHQGKGWEKFTDAIIRVLSERKEPLVFLLWGKTAQDKCKQIPGFENSKQHLVLKAPHPSPLSAHQGFLGCKHFSQTNAFLAQNLQKPIDWHLYRT